MTKSKQNAKALKAEQKKNYDEMISLMKIENPDRKDINYLQGVMKGKKFNRDNRNELTKILTDLEEAIEAKAPTSETAPETNKMTRAQMFEEIRKDLIEVSNKCLAYSRVEEGGCAMRLNTVSRECKRMALNTLRD